MNKKFYIGLIQPKDRDYNKKNKPREERIEVFRGGGIAYAENSKYPCNYNQGVIKW